MTYYKDLGTKSMMASGPYVRAVGWLDDKHPFTRGEVPGRLLEKLREYSSRWLDCVTALGWPVAGGAHTCELCGEFMSAGNFAVPAGDLLYICPEMICHYVEAHQYLPPPVFLEALDTAPLPGTDAYAAQVARFEVSWE